MQKALAIASLLIVLSVYRVSSRRDDDGRKKRPTHLCNGKGERFCGDAHEEMSCPEECRPENCDNGRPRSRLAKQYDRIIDAGKYDFVYYLSREKTICIAHCSDNDDDDWKKMECEDRTETEV